MLVGLCLEFYSGYDDGLLRGIAAYTRPHKEWTFTHAWPTLAGISAVLAKQPTGIIIRTRDTALLELIAKAKVHTVNFTNQAHVGEFGQVSNDNRRIGAMAAEHFLSRGDTRFGYFLLQPDRVDERLLGFADQLKLAGHTCDVFEGSPDHESFEEQNASEIKLKKWLLGLAKPVGIFCDGDRFAWTIAEHCRRLALRVPEDVAILGVDNVASMCALSDPPLSSIQTASERIGYEACQLLEQMMVGRPPKQLVIEVPPVRVVNRRSSDGVSVEDTLVREALEHMCAHLLDTVGMESLCQRLECSRRTLERRFRECLGYSPAEAWSRFRLEEAQRLLADTDLTLSIVAQRCGFHVPKQMASVFRRMTGRSPRDFRRLAQPASAS